MGYIIIFIIIIFIIVFIFNNNESKELKEIKISDSASKITESKFADYSNLENVKIPNSVTEIGRYAFVGCSSLKEIKIPNSITKIDDGVFESCSNLENVEIPNSVTEIGKGTFAGCSNLAEIKIPDSVTLIGDSAFARCSNLKKIIIPQSVIKMEGSIFAGCSSLKEIIIPKSIKRVGENTFYRCEKLEKATIPESVISIGNRAFSYCSSLTEIKIPSLVTSIQKGTFSYCSSLRKIKIPNSVTMIDNSAFSYCSSLEEVKIPSSVTFIGRDAFSYCSSLREIEIPNSVTFIGENTFLLCDNIYICCNKGSYAERYAKGNNISFKYISDTNSQYVNNTNKDSLNKAKSKELTKNSYNKETKRGLKSHKPKSFREFYSNKTKEQLKNDVDEVYYSKLRELNLKDASFGTNGSKEFLGAIELALFEKKLKPYIEQGIKNVFTRDWGGLDFSEYMDEIVEKYSSITINEWNESYRYFEKNHSWLDKHPCASPEVAMKRFEFLRERNSNSKENIVSDRDKLINDTKAQIERFIQADEELSKVSKLATTDDEKRYLQAYVLKEPYLTIIIPKTENFKKFTELNARKGYALDPGNKLGYMIATAVVLSMFYILAKGFADPREEDAIYNLIDKFYNDLLTSDKEVISTLLALEDHIRKQVFELKIKQEIIDIFISKLRNLFAEYFQNEY